MPKVSVVMPIYKTKKEHLQEAIESILNQTFKDFEFLILDDCPEDNRENIVLSYQDDRIKYIKNEQNLGITPSRNKLIDMAQGEYLAVMDHDDISLPQRFEKQVEFLDLNPSVGVVGCWVDCFPENQKLHFPSNDMEIKKLLTDICAIVHPSSMIRKSVLTDNNLRYEQMYSPSEDYCLWLRLIEHTQFYNIPEVLFNYRLHPDNTSKHQAQKMRDVTQQLHLWVRNKYPFLYQSYCSDRYENTYIKLFKIIPLIKIKKQTNKTKVYLFNCIPLLIIQKKVKPWSK